MANIKETKMIFEVTPPDQAIMLESIHGIGKSEFVKDYWESKGYRVITLFCSQMADAGDLIGLPDRMDIDGVKTTIFAQPYWWPKENEKVVIFLDELNRAKPEILQCVQDMVLNRKLAGKPLPPETRIISAINPYGDETDYDVAELEITLLDRFNKVPFFPDYNEWIDWALKNRVHKLIIGFISKNAANFLDPPAKTKSGEVYQSRRSWKRLSDIINNHPELLENDVNLKIIANSIVGIGASSKFSMYVKENFKGLNVGLIVTAWNKELEQTVKHMPNQELININDELAAYIEQNQATLFITPKLAEQHANNVYMYLRTVPKEIIAHFFGLINTATNNGKSWQDVLLSNSQKLVDYFVDIVKGKSEHEKEVERIINEGNNEEKEWE
ncbi:MAG: ATPase [Candidatus Woesearchaeota archaeon]